MRLKLMNRTRLHRNAQRGFSLLELMVVVIVVAILTTIAVARYMDMRDRGLVAAAIHDLDLARKMLAYYASDYDHYPLSATTYDELKTQLLDPQGQSYGSMPLANTFQWFSYSLDEHGEYQMRVLVADHRRTTLVATPARIYKEDVP
jgi:prepilin-type N-terminal cleavage/methylation domain-containing protein